MASTCIHRPSCLGGSPKSFTAAIRKSSVLRNSARQQDHRSCPAHATRRDVLEYAGLGVGLSLVLPALADDYTVTPSGLRYFDVRTGNGRTPGKGDYVLLDWSGFTEGYQGKRIGNSTKTDEPFRFQIGAGEAIPAIEEAVQSMSVGGVRRVEILGSKPELGYSLDKSERFSGQRLTGDYFKYKMGPQPINLSGQRALDFVLDNPTLQDFNRTLLFDIKLVSISR